MSRSDQMIGLKHSVENLLKPEDKCLTCKIPPAVFKEIPGKYQTIGMFEDTYNLPGYILKTGETVYECEQVTYWSSGPMIFTALKNESGEWIKETLWTNKEINKIEEGLVDDDNQTPLE